MRQSTTRQAEIDGRSVWLVVAILAASAFLVLTSDSAQERDPVETHKLLTSDGEQNDGFGVSVAIGGSTTVLGGSWAALTSQAERIHLVQVVRAIHIRPV